MLKEGGEWQRRQASNPAHDLAMPRNGVGWQQPGNQQACTLRGFVGSP